MSHRVTYTGPVTSSILQTVRCPRCAAPLDVRAVNIVCSNCGSAFPRIGGIPVLLRDPQAYLQSCRRQLALVEQHAQRTIQSIGRQLEMRDLLPLTRMRCRRIMEAVRDQTADICEILRQLAGEDAADPVSGESPAPLQYIHYLYRDWGWPADPDGENERVLASVRSVLDGHTPQRMLVVGAGACRLAYDLHRLDAQAETIVVDIDPFLFVAAHRVIRGESLTMREVNAEVHEAENVVKKWVLQAPHGPITDESFHFMLADGLEPPVASASFDTVVTPWFIDLIPPDLRNFMSEVYRLLKPKGRWINIGPLLYRQDVPITRRFTREEVFDLAGRAGLRMDNWKAESMPYLVSKLNGRGKVERVLAFGATRLERPPESELTAGSCPSWLLFTHIPVPAFPGQSTFQTEDPAEHIVLSAIDGRNTLDDIAAILISNAGDSGITLDQFREIARRCLMAIHPDCNSGPADSSISDLRLPGV